MRFATAGSADEQQIGALVDPAVAGADRQDTRLGEHRHEIEVEAVQRLAGQELRLREVTREATAVAFRDLVLGKRGEEACGGPAFLVRPVGQCWPILLDCGQAKIVEHQCQAGVVDVLGHAATRISAPSSTS